MKCYEALLVFNLPWQQLGYILQRLEGFTITHFCFSFFFFCMHVHTHLNKAALDMAFIQKLYSNLIKSPNGLCVGHSLPCVCMCVCVCLSVCAWLRGVCVLVCVLVCVYVCRQAKGGLRGSSG